VPEAIHAPECGGVWGEEVRPVGKYRKEEAIGDEMAPNGCDTSPWEGQALAKEEDGLGPGQEEPMPEVVDGGEGGGEPVL